MKALRLLLIIVFTVLALLLPTSAAIAQSNVAQSDYAAYQQMLPNFDSITFESLGAVENGGSVDLGGAGRQWSAGDSLADILTIGDVESLNGQSLSLGQISGITGTNWAEGSLSSFELLSDQSLSGLVDSIPFLGSYQIEEVAPVKQLLSEQTGIETFDDTISAFLGQNPGLVDTALSETDLSSFAISEIPNADSVPLSYLEGWDSSSISGVPGPTARATEPVSQRHHWIAGNHL